MACCSLKRPGTTSWASIVLVCVPLEIIGQLMMLVLVPASLILAPARGSRDALSCLLVRNHRVIDDRLRPLGWRCTVAGALLRPAPWLAGRVFRGFYVGLATSSWIGAVLLLVALPLLLLVAR
jgi:hypothetical protein